MSGPGAGRSRTGRTWLAAAAVLASLVLGVWILLSAGVGLGRAVPWAARTFAPEGWTIELADVRGSWLSPLRVRGVRIALPGWEAEVDSLLIRYRLGPVVGRRIEITSLDVFAPKVGRRGLAAPPAQSDQTVEEEEGEDGAWTIELNGLSLYAGQLTLGRDTCAYLVHEVDLWGSAELAPGRTVARLDSLRARIAPPGDLSPARVSAAAGWEKGRMRVNRLRLESARSSLRARGMLTLPPLGTDPTDRVDLTLSATPLDLRDLPLGWSGRSSQLDATLTARSSGDSLLVQLDAQGLHDKSADVRLALDGKPGTGDRSGRWSASLDVGEGGVRGRGTARLRNGATSIRASELAVADLDLSSVSTGWPTTRITGRLDGDLTLGDERPTGALDVDLGPSLVAETLVDSAAVRLQLAADTHAGGVALRLLGGRVETDLSAAPLDEVPWVRFRGGRFDSLQASTDSAAAVVVSGAFAGEVRSPSGGLVADTNVRLNPSRLGPLVVSGGEIKGSLAPGETAIRASLMLGSGGVARVRADLPGPGHWAWREAPTGEAELRIEGALVGSGRVDSAVLDVRADSGRVAVRGLVRPSGAAGGLTLSGHGRVGADRIRIDALGAGSLPAVGAFLGLPPDSFGIDTLQARFRAVAGGSQPMDLQTKVSLGEGRWRNVRLDSATMDLALDSGGLRVDTLALASNVLSASAAGRLPATEPVPESLHARARIHDLRPLAPWLVGMRLGSTGGALRTSLAGTLDSVAVDTDVTLNGLSTERMQIARADLTASGVLRREAEAGTLPLVGTLDATVSRIVTPTAQVRSVALRAQGDTGGVSLDVTADVDRTRAGELTMRVDPRPHRREVRIERVELSLDEDRWRLTGPAVVSYRNGVATDELELVAGRQRIALKGHADSLGGLDVEAAIDSTNIGTVSDLMGMPGLNGWIEGRVRVQGTTSAPTGTARAMASLAREDSETARAELDLTSDGTRIGVDGALTHPRGEPLTVGGTVPVDALLPGDSVEAFGPLELNLRSDDFALAWLDVLLGPSTVRDLEGVLRLDAALGGTPNALRLQGSVAADSVSAFFPALGVEWRDGRVRAQGDGDRLVVEEAVIAGGGGTARADGTVSLGDLPRLGLDLEVRLDGFQAIRSSQARAVASGALAVAGTLARPTVEGRLELLSLDVYLDEQVGDQGLEDVELTEADLDMLRKRFGFVPPGEEPSPPLLDRLTADLTIDLSRDSWVRKRANPEMAVAFTGAMDLRLRPGEPIRADGSLSVIEGRGFIEQFGRRFELAEGSVTLDGPVDDARARVRARYTIPSHDNPDEAEVTIYLEVGGSQDDLRLTLSSDPPMENADIVSYIATGRPASGRATFGAGESEDGGLLSAGAGFALDQLTGIVEDAAEGNVGLDVVEIRREGLREATLVAGKYVTPRIYLGFSQPVSLRQGDGLSLGGEGASEVEIEYEAFRWLIVNLEGSGSAFHFFLRGRRAY